MRFQLELKRRIGEGLFVAANGAGMVLSLCGASAVAVLGKLMLAVVLTAVAFGFFLRLSGRRRNVQLEPVRPPAWCYVTAGVLASVEVALLAEATDLPVRFSQPGFEFHHWLLVLAALAVAFIVHMQIFRSICRKRQASPQP